MKIKEYIEFKRQYFPPRSRLIDLVAEGSLLAAQTGEVKGENGGSGDGNGGNPTYPPFGGAKANSRVFFDDETEE